MSGGSHEYLEFKIRDMYVNGEETKIIDKYTDLRDIVKDLCEVLHAYEWWQSGDWGEETFVEEYTNFKNKYFGKDYVDGFNQGITAMLFQMNKYAPIMNRERKFK